MKNRPRIPVSKKNRWQAIAAVGILGCCLLPSSLQAAARTWSGNTDDVMGTSTNWSAAPITGDSMVFSSTNASGDFNLNNNLTSGSFGVLGITFNAGSPSYILGDGSSTSGSVGNTFILNGNVANNSTNLQTILNPFSMTATRTFAGNLTLGGDISGSGGLLSYTSAGNTLTLNGSNSYTGGSTFGAGNIVLGNKLALGSGTASFNGVTVSANTDLSGANAIANNFTLGGTNTFTGTNNIQLSGSLASTPSRTITNNMTSGSLTLSNATLNIGAGTTTTATLTINGSGNTVISGNLLNNVTGPGTSALTYVGTGKLTLSGANTYTGATTLNSGTLVLDFGGASSPASNIISSTLNLGSTVFVNPVMGAGKETLQIIGKANFANAQSNAWTLNAGAAHLDLSTSGTGTLTYTISAVTRNTGSTVDITQSSGVTISTAVANASNGLFSGGSVILDRKDFAINSGGSLVAYTGYTPSTATTMSGVSDVVGDVTLSSAAALSAIRFNNTNNATGPITVTLASDTVTLNPGGTGQGMILVTPTAGSFLTKITGGLMGSNVSNRDLVIVQNNTAGDLQIDTRITQFSGDTAGNSLTKSGTGKLILTSNNTYGAGAGTIINEGTLVVTGDRTTSSTQSATLSSSSTTVTGVDTTGLFIGQRVTGTGFGTVRGGYITGITAGTGTSGSFTVNAAPSVSGTQTVFFSGSGGLGLGVGATAVNVGLGATLQIGNGGTTGSLALGQGINSAGAITINRSNGLTISSGITLNGASATGVNTASLTNAFAGTTVVLDDGLTAVTANGSINNLSLSQINSPVTFSGGGGSGASAIMTSLGLGQSSITVAGGGSGWVTGNTITVGGNNGTAAVYTVTASSGVITGLTLNNPGANNGYSSLSGLTFTGAKGTAVPAFAGTGATFNTVDGTLSPGTFNLNAAGSGYTSAPTASSSWGTGVAATLTLTGTQNQLGGDGNLTIMPVISGATGGIVKVGSGVLTLSGANTYAGPTTVNAGTLTATKAAALPGYNSSAKVTFNGGTVGVQIGGGGWTTGEVDTLLTNATKTGGALGIDTSLGGFSQWTSFTTTNLGPNLGLAKLGAGTLTLDQTNTYTGQTTVGAGTLLLASTGSISNSTVIQIQSGATLDATAVTGGFQLASGQKLQNKGTFLGNLTALSGSTYAPGNSVGISNQSGNVVLNTGSTFEFELVSNKDADNGGIAGIDFDQTQFTLPDTTDLTIQTGVNVSLVFNFAGSTVDWTNTFWDADQSWLVFTGADTATFAGGSGIFTGTTSVSLDSLGQNFSLAGGSFSFSNTGSEVYLNYTAIPEPSTYALLAGGLGLLAFFRRRSKS